MSGTFTSSRQGLNDGAPKFQRTAIPGYFNNSAPVDADTISIRTGRKLVKRWKPVLPPTGDPRICSATARADQLASSSRFRQGAGEVSEPNPLDLVLGKPFFRSIIEFRRPRALVRRHLLGVLERSRLKGKRLSSSP